MDKFFKNTHGTLHSHFARPKFAQRKEVGEKRIFFVSALPQKGEAGSECRTAEGSPSRIKRIMFLLISSQKRFALRSVIATNY